MALAVSWVHMTDSSSHYILDYKNNIFYEYNMGYRTCFSS